ncbi:MAG: hypothetical protein CEN90_696 [Parcubacteria group bacterium Licking1014_17]|nr:MAG: hypothetical protein CEN90_696 [Parcubacteria group bacterium Licking1014_17]
MENFSDINPRVGLGRAAAKILVVLILLVLITVLFGPRLLMFGQNALLPFMSKWQVVYLANGEIYVGKISGMSGSQIKLKNAHNLQLANSEQITGQTTRLKLESSAAKNLSLIRWGFYQPLKSQGEIYISRQVVLFWETLDDDSQIVRQINAAK